MSVTVKEFWKLAYKSRLFDRDRCKRLHEEFSRIPGAAGQSNAIALSEWLVAERHLTRYQTKILLAGRPGPFLFGDYLVRDRIDSDRLDGVFRATHLPTKHPVCLLFLAGEAANDPPTLARLSLESASAASIQSSQVARHYHFVDLGTYKFFVLADLVGRSLDELLAGNRKLSPSDACRHARQIALGLSQIHAAKRLHGEIRPENIWIDPSGQARLLYFPLWRDPAAGPSSPTDLARQNDSRALAAADYLAPELIAGGRAADERTDLYALGCLLYHMLAGKPPFPGDDINRKLKQQQFEQPQSLQQLNPQAPPPLAQVTAYLMAKDPSQRYQQAAHAAEALLPYVDPAAAQAKADPATAESRAFEVWLLRNAPAAPQVTSKASLAPLPPPTRPPTAAAPVAIPVTVPAIAQEFPSALPPAAATLPLSVPPAMPFAQPVVAVPLPFGTLPAGLPRALPAVATPGVVPAYAIPQAAPAPGLVLQAIPAASHAVRPSPAPFGEAAPGLALGENKSVGGSSFAANQRASAKSQRGNLLLVFGGIGVLAAAVALIVYFNRPTEAALKPSDSIPADSQPQVIDAGKVPAAIPAEPPKGTGDATNNASVAVDEGKSEALVAIDAQPMWESPTSGKPLDLSYLPPGAQLFIALRPAELWAHPEGAKVAATLGSFGDALRQTLLKQGGAPLEDIESAVFGFLDAGAGRPAQMAVAVRLGEPIDEPKMLQNWGDPKPAAIGGATVYQADGMTFWTPLKERGKVLVSAPMTDPKQIEDWLAGAANQPALRREMEALARGSHASRHVNVLFAPNFLFAGGKSLFAGPLEKLREPLKFFLSDEAGNLPQAGLLSMHLGDDLFLELRLYGSADKPPALLAKEIRTRVQGLTPAVDDYLAGLNISPYSKKILQRYPRWIEQLDLFARAGTSEKQAVLRCYLPGVAAQNLAFGTQLALVESGGASTTTATGGDGPKSLADVLKQKYTLVFPRDSLERTMEQIAKDLNVTITINGGDLQLEGITKNQSFGLDEKDKPLTEILQTICAKANTAGKLIYVIKKDGSKESLVITTRAAAEKRKDPIPPEFQKK